MVVGSANSKNEITVRLTGERWFHIIYSHREIDSTDFSLVLDAVENPDIILGGDSGELLAVKKRASRKDASRKEWFVVIYKEVNKTDGFIITAYLTTDVRWLLKRKVIWSKDS